MKIPTEAVLLRIYLTEAAKWEHKPLYEAIVMRAREMGISGATVLRGPMGYGRSSHMHTAKILDLSMNLPVVVEIFESEAMIDAFLPVLDEMLASGHVTMEKVRVLHYGGPGEGA
jgi:PII-like signaling protein